MKPSRKILLGASAILTGILLQAAAGLLAMRSVENITEEIKSGGPHASMVTDLHLEQSHWEMTASFFGTGFGYVFLVAGLFLFLAGTYHNAKNTEQLLESQRHQTPPQVP